MFQQLKEVHEKVFYIKESLLSLDSQLGHLQDLSALTVDILKVLSAVDTLKVEEALLADTKHQTCRKLPHSWSNAFYSKTLSSLEGLCDKKYHYYSMPPSLLRSLVRTQSPSECKLLKSEGNKVVEDSSQKAEIETDTLTSGVSSETKSTPRYGQFLLVPPDHQGGSFPEDVTLNLSFLSTAAKYKDEAFRDDLQSSIVVPQNLSGISFLGKETEGCQWSQRDFVTHLPSEKIDAAEADHPLDLQLPLDIEESVASPCDDREETEGGYVNWGFSEGDEKGVFISDSKKKALCLHSSYDRDNNCQNNPTRLVQLSHSKSFSYNSVKSCPSSSSSISQNRLKRSISFWISPLWRDWSFCRSNSLPFPKKERSGKVFCKAVGGNYKTLNEYSIFYWKVQDITKMFHLHPEGVRCSGGWELRVQSYSFTLLVWVWVLGISKMCLVSKLQHTCVPATLICPISWNLHGCGYTARWQKDCTPSGEVSCPGDAKTEWQQSKYIS